MCWSREWSTLMFAVLPSWNQLAEHATIWNNEWLVDRRLCHEVTKSSKGLRFCTFQTINIVAILPTNKPFTVSETSPWVCGGLVPLRVKKKHGLLIKDTVNFHDDKQIMYMNLLNTLLHFLFQVYAVIMVHMNISACTCINFRVWVGDWCPAS